MQMLTAHHPKHVERVKNNLFFLTTCLEPDSFALFHNPIYPVAVDYINLQI
jgi:hypothetical protein